ncbi:MAG: elongation factor Ts, partial [Bifidobacteriaceae bacterium]|nr:elongation factor Ts [Bifidobacteriaceae bacterium]
YITRDDIPAEKVADERRIAGEIALAEGKPEAALPKIIEGRVIGYFKETVLVDQVHARDPKHKETVGQVLKAAGGTVTGFARFRVGA